MTARLLFALLLLVVRDGNGLENGLARTPPMGWMSWSRFFCEVDCTLHPFGCINEMLYKTHADRLVHDGFRDAGYRSIHVDDCWSAHTRDAGGRLVANADRFPHGMAGLADYMHQLGLGFAIYSDDGPLTCARYPGSSDHEAVDARTFADWKVDYLKYDGCFSNKTDKEKRYPLMGAELLKTGRPMVYSCEWPMNLKWEDQEPDYAAIASTCNLWRNFDDVENSFKSIMRIINWYVDHQDTLARFQRPGAWNDPDMIVAGNPGVPFSAARLQFVVWCMWSAPLIMSNDLRLLDDQHRELLQNPRLIAIDQDELGVFGKVLKKSSSLFYFVKEVTPVSQTTKKTSFAIGIINHSKNPARAAFLPRQLGLTNPNGYSVMELVSGEVMQDCKIMDPITYTVPGMDAVAFKFTIKE